MTSDDKYLEQLKAILDIIETILEFPESELRETLMTEIEKLSRL